MQAASRNNRNVGRTVAKNVNVVYPGPPPPLPKAAPLPKTAPPPKNTPPPKPKIIMLENVNTPSLKMVLSARQSSRQAPSSLQVNTGWVLSNLEGADEAAELLKYNITQDEDIVEAEDLEMTDPRYLNDVAKAKDSSRLIREVMDDIKREFKSSDGLESKPYSFNLGVGRELSELLDDIKSQAGRNQTAESTWVRSQRSNPDDPIRDKRGFGLEATGKPPPG